MEGKIEVPIGNKLLELADRLVDHCDPQALELVSDVAHELLTTDVVVSADISFLTFRVMHRMQPAESKGATQAKTSSQTSCAQVSASAVHPSSGSST